jgi:hypothetical protein
MPGAFEGPTRKGLEGREAFFALCAKNGAKRNPGKPGFWREAPKMRPMYLNHLSKCKTAGQVACNLFPPGCFIYKAASFPSFCKPRPVIPPPGRGFFVWGGNAGVTVTVKYERQAYFMDKNLSINLTRAAVHPFLKVLKFAVLFYQNRKYQSETQLVFLLIEVYIHF